MESKRYFFRSKENHNLRKAKYRGLNKMQIQAYMTSTVQNIKRFEKANLDKYRSFLEDYLDKFLMFEFIRMKKSYIKKKNI